MAGSGGRERRDRDDERRRERDRDHEGDDPRRHADIINARWVGSSPPTAERYANALRQWRALPGAVTRSATDAAPAPKSDPTGEAEAP